MSRATIDSVIHHLRALVVDPDTAGVPDGALLERFLTRRDEAAFEALVRRHGPMVLGVCRRHLPHAQDAEDAFQATFLVLVRKAAGIKRRELLGNWLYGVAFQTARAARAAADRRRAKEAKAMPRQPAPTADGRPEWGPVLDEELSRLPDKYRRPVILCHLQGQSRHEAARALGLPEGTLSSRLARARALLARRLARRGVTLTAGALVAALGPEATAAVLPPALIVTTVQAGGQALVGPLAAGAISVPVAALTEKVVKAMWLSKLMVALTALLAGSVLALGAGAFASRHLRAARPTPEEQGPALAAAPVPREDVRPLLQQALEAAQAITDPREKLHTLLRIAAVQNETGDHAGALKTCRAALVIARALPDDRSKVRTVATIAMFQAEAGDRAAGTETLKLAKQATDAIQDAHQKGNALLELVHAQGVLGEYEGALRTAKEGGDYQGSALGRSFPMSLRKPDKPAARKALREAAEMMKSLPENNQRQFLPPLAAAQVRMEDLEGALKTIDLLSHPWKRVGQESVAVAQARTGDVAGALRTLKGMESAAPGGGRLRAPDRMRGRVLQAVARAQAKAGDRAGAEATLKSLSPLVDDFRAWEARRAAGPRMPGMNGLSPAAELEAQIALTHYHLGDVAAARKTALAIKSEYEKARALLEIGEAEAAAGRQAAAREFLLAAAHAAESVRPGAPGDWPPASGKNATLRMIAEQQAKVGDVREALRTVESIGTEQERENALVSVAPAQAAAGDVKGALQTLARIKANAEKERALEDIVAALVNAGDERGALGVVEGQKSPALKARALLGLAKGRAKAKAGKS